MENRTIWLRLGVQVNGTKEEIESLFSNDVNECNNALMNLINKRQYLFNGNSYIPETCVEEYNKEYGTNHEVGDYDFYL